MVDLESVLSYELRRADKVGCNGEKKICINCGIPGLGTGLHLEHLGSTGSMQPAVIPSEYLVTRLSIIDVSYLAKSNPSLVLSLDVALQWPVLKYDPLEPTLVLFKFGWSASNQLKRRCVCKIPGLSYELADFIASNLSHVVGVATDAPTLESDQTRELTKHTVSNVLGRSGVYMIENVHINGRIPG
ncbi:Kynurenine formamidase [Danaus plexippus plexippus]|uniref:Kynurenine formamidase n=1 Tax=Danaus plexippus plexippus TaxID=278856 RepID=A0A212FHN2_DANPL|nr:Kynurenine formamidase [Danaus plexippus plexippus]